MFWLPMLAGAALGAGKHFAFDKPQQKRTAMLRAEETRLSPFTGRGPKTEIAYANPVGSMLQGASTGASLWSGMQNAEMNKKFADIALNSAKQNPTSLIADYTTDLGFQRS